MAYVEDANKRIHTSVRTRAGGILRKCARAHMHARTHAHARTYANKGARVILVARTLAKLEALSDELNAAYGAGTAVPLACDGSDAGAVDAAAERVQREMVGKHLRWHKVH